MAMTLNIKYISPRGPISEGGDATKEMVGSVAFDNSYPTGGELLDLTEWFTTVALVLFAPTSGYVFQYDYTNKKVLAYYADYDAGADGALIQVANTTDLSALADVRFLAKGF